jgi:hypothetical protein
MSNRRPAEAPKASTPEVRSVLAWLRVAANQRLVREAAVWAVWLVLREKDPATALEVIVRALRGPCESVSGRKLPNPDRFEVIAILAYLRGVLDLPGLVPVASPWTWGELTALAKELADRGGRLSPFWHDQVGTNRVARSVSRVRGIVRGRHLVQRPENLTSWARSALAAVGK